MCREVLEILKIVAAGILAGAAHLHQEFSVLGEFQQLRVLGAIAPDPHIALVVHVNPVVGLRPLKTLTGAAPGAHQVAGGVEDQHRRGGAAAEKLRRVVPAPARGAAVRLSQSRRRRDRTCVGRRRPV